MKCLASLLFLVSISAHANWIFVSEGSDSRVYVDYSTIKRTNDYVKAWVLFDMHGESVSPDKKVKYKSSKTLEEFDCGVDRSKTIEFIWYSKEMGAGSIAYRDKGNDYPWVAFPKGSINSRIKQNLCNVEFRKNNQ